MQSVRNALQVLEAIASSQPAGLSALTHTVGLPKATVQRCITTLHEEGWIVPAGGEARKWRVSSKAFSVGSAAAEDRDLRSTAMPVLAALQSAVDETVHLMIPDGDDVVLIERLDSAHELRTFSMLGSRSPMHATANGKAILAALPHERVEAYLATRLTPITGRTIIDPAALRAQLEEIRVRGYATNRGELRDHVASVGAAIVLPEGPVASLSVSGPTIRLTKDRFEAVGEHVRRAAVDLSRALGRA